MTKLPFYFLIFVSRQQEKFKRDAVRPMSTSSTPVLLTCVVGSEITDGKMASKGRA